MKEIISLSFGKHSNFMSTHYWNAQDENFKVIQDMDEQEYKKAYIELGESG